MWLRSFGNTDPISVAVSKRMTLEITGVPVCYVKLKHHEPTQAQEHGSSHRILYRV